MYRQSANQAPLACHRGGRSSPESRAKATEERHNDSQPVEPPVGLRVELVELSGVAEENPSALGALHPPVSLEQRCH